MPINNVVTFAICNAYPGMCFEAAFMVVKSQPELSGGRANILYPTNLTANNVAEKVQEYALY